MSRIGPGIAGAALALLLGACGDSEPPVLTPPDAGDWATWPPQPGSAGFELLWTVEGQAPTGQSCSAVDLDRVRLGLVHPVADFETWTAPDLTADCELGAIVRPPADGLAPGRYRFKVELLHGGGEPFQHEPWGEALLVADQVTTIAVVNVTEASPADAGQ
jgi:hypothetical protein